MACTRAYCACGLRSSSVLRYSTVLLVLGSSPQPSRSGLLDPHNDSMSSFNVATQAFFSSHNSGPDQPATAARRASSIRYIRIPAQDEVLFMVEIKYSRHLDVPSKRATVGLADPRTYHGCSWYVGQAHHVAPVCDVLCLQRLPPPPSTLSARL